jgi:signal transduction histidine kinase
MKLFPKLTLSVSSLLAGTMIGLTLCFYWSERRQIYADAVLERQSLLKSLVHIAQESFLADDDLLLVKYTRWIASANPSLISVSVMDAQGGVLAHSEPERIGRRSLQNDGRPAGALVLSQPIPGGNQPVGTASIVFSEQEIQRLFRERLKALQHRLAAVALTAFAAGLILCLTVASSWSHPIRDLAEAADRVGLGLWQLDLKALSRRGDEVGSLSRSFESMTRRLRELDMLKEDFVSAVTHELRSPLGAIESYLNLIADELHEGTGVDAWNTYIERLRLNTQRLTRFVNDLLDVSALERGHVRLDKKRLDVVALSKEVVELFALRLSEKRLSCDILSPVGNRWVEADTDKIRQVLINLLSNAIKFTPAGGRIRLFMDEDALKNRIHVHVADSGIGIAECDQDKIFNKFEQVSAARSSVQGPKGTGLGLSISKSLIELHGHQLEVKSQPGQGSVFSFALTSAPAHSR